MKIAILIPSRNRLRLLSAAITALHEMESGEHDIKYLVGCDHDDWETRTVSGPGITTIITEQITIGGIWNELAHKINADIYSCMIDDAFPITPHWDKQMVAMAAQYEAFSWFEVSAPSNIGYPTCTRAWLDKVGYIVPEHFPFWFMDTAFAEIVQFVTDKPVPISQQLALFSKQEATQNLRDLEFWWKFFSATRAVRVMEAHRIVGGMSLEDFTVSRTKWILLGEQRDAQFIGQQRLKDIEASKGVIGEPSTRYIASKARAEKYLIDNGLV